jgi:radical SAM protein with 4Fe4S-binding SPASM domain
MNAQELSVTPVDPKRPWRHERDYKVVHIGDQSAVFLTGNHRVLITAAELGRRLEKGLDQMTADEASEWSLLESHGWLTDVHRSRLATSTYSDGSNLALNINLTGACNLACTYCFAEGGDYGRIYQKMEMHTVDYIFDFIRRHVTKSRKVRFEFFGGEPLLNFPIIKEICERSDRLAAETGIEFCNRISTNLTVMPAGVIEFFHARKFIVSVSIDGGAETHNQNRPTKSGKESFAGIIGNCKKVREGGDAVTMVARMTVVSPTPPLIDNVLELHQLNIFDYFQIYPAVTAPGSSLCGGTPKLVQLETSTPPEPIKNTMNMEFLNQLAELVKIYPKLYGNGNRFKGVLEYERIAEMLLQGKMALGFCGGGGTYFTFSPDDSIMPCHRLVGDTKYQIGSGATGLTGDTQDWTLPVDSHPICSDCWARYVCGGNCRQENVLSTGSLRGLNMETCQYQQSLLAEVIRYLGTAPADYLTRSRKLDDMFVSCGRPVTNNLRESGESEVTNLRYFQVIMPHQSDTQVM